ncbi:MAG: hypothetical protein ABIH83_04430, partial [Candidatus Micrarchaeota archaeon]
MPSEAQYCKGEDDATATCCDAGLDCIDDPWTAGDNKECCAPGMFILGDGCCTDTVSCDAGEYLCTDTDGYPACASGRNPDGSCVGTPNYNLNCLVCDESCDDAGSTMLTYPNGTLWCGSCSDGSTPVMYGHVPTCNSGTLEAEAVQPCQICEEIGGENCTTASGAMCCIYAGLCLTDPDTTDYVCCNETYYPDPPGWPLPGGAVACADGTCCPSERALPPSPSSCTDCCNPNEEPAQINIAEPNMYVCCENKATQYAGADKPARDASTTYSLCCALGTTPCAKPDLDPLSECCSSGASCSDTYDPFSDSYCCPSGQDICTIIGIGEVCCNAVSSCLDDDDNPGTNICCPPGREWCPEFGGAVACCSVGDLCLPPPS